MMPQIIVTGAASGIGAATARRLASDGASVIIADISAEGVDLVVRDLRRDGLRADGLVVDVADPVSVTELFEQVRGRRDPLRGVVCAAGISIRGPSDKFPLSDWERVLSVNLTGTMLCFQAAVCGWAQSGYGCSLVAVASTLGVIGASQGAAYAASKAGVIALVRSYALEWSRSGIRVNCVAPGVTETPMLGGKQSETFVEEWIARNPRGRLGRPADLAAAISYLMSDEADWVTGQTLHVNGGSYFG